MKSVKTVFGVAFLFMLFMSFFTQIAVGQAINKGEDNIAIQGYDPVAYFTQGKPVKGDASVSVKHDDAVYHFSSKANARQFEKNPEKYTPQYGGFCAFGIASGSKYPINPETFKIKDGKLFLFFNKDGTNTLNMWNQAELKSQKEADSKWESGMSK